MKENLALAWIEDNNENPDEENNIGVDMDKIKELETQIAKLKTSLEEATNILCQNLIGGNFSDLKKEERTAIIAFTALFKKIKDLLEIV